MSVIGSKQQSLSSVDITLDGGLNFHAAPNNINDNELIEALNVLYVDQELYPSTRPGLICHPAPKLDDPIDKVFFYRKSLSESYLVCVSNSKLYRMDHEANAWVLVGDLDIIQSSPSMIVYDNRLIIADGGQFLKVWDGETLTSLTGTGSPQYASAVLELGGRLVTNDGGAGEYDTVRFSGMFGYDKWDTAAEVLADRPAFFRCGYGDGMNVVGFEALGKDLLVFKSGAGKRVFRLNTSGNIDTDWYVEQVSKTSTCSGPDACEAIHNDIIYGDDAGLKSIVGVTEYGDLNIAFLGLKISPEIRGRHVKQLVFSPILGVLFCLFDSLDYIYVYHPHTKGFTRIDFGTHIRSICEDGSATWFVGTSGYLYRFGTSDTDELEPGVETDITSIVTTKSFTVADEVLLKNTRVYYDNLSSNKGALYIIGRDGVTTRKIYEWQPQFGGFIYDATMDIFDANDYLFDFVIGYYDARGKYRDQSMSFSAVVSKGRLKLRSMTVTFAPVNG